MTWLVIESWLLLFSIGIVMRVLPFKALHSIVRCQQIVAKGIDAPDVERVCRAVDLACVFYFKRVMCLQRSSATTLLLRRYGWNAQLVIGAQIRPFKSHAWVEIDERVVNDKSDMPELYQVLERC